MLEVGGQELSPTVAGGSQGAVGWENSTILFQNVYEEKLRHREAMPWVTQPWRAKHRLASGAHQELYLLTLTLSCLPGLGATLGVPPWLAITGPCVFQ